MRAKRDTILVYFAQLAKTEDLKTAGVSKDAAAPRHEFVQSAKGAYGFMSGTKVEMVGVPKQDPNTEFLENMLRNTLHRTGSSDRHEDGSLNLAVWRGDPTEARRAVAGFNIELKRHSELNCKLPDAEA